MNIELPARGWVPAQSVLMLAVVSLGVAFRGQWLSSVGFSVGAFLFVIAAGIGVTGVLALGTNRTAKPEPLPDARLVEHGIYGRIRHPLYASVMLAGFGWGLLWQSWPALGAAVVQVAFFNAKAQREENLLQKRFPDYARYAGRTNRFIPWLV